jgi:hypothetical protein
VNNRFNQISVPRTDIAVHSNSTINLSQRFAKRNLGKGVCHPVARARSVLSPNYCALTTSGGRNANSALCTVKRCPFGKKYRDLQRGRNVPSGEHMRSEETDRTFQALEVLRIKATRPAIRERRASKGLPTDPLSAFRESGYLGRITRERAARNSQSVSFYA